MWNYSIRIRRGNHVNNTVSYIFVYYFFIVCVYTSFYIGGWDFWVLLSWWQNQGWTQLPFANYKANSRWKDFLYEVFVSVHINSVFYWKNRFYSAKLRNLSWTCHLHWLIDYNGIDPLGSDLKCSRWNFCFCSGRTQTQYKMSRLYTWIEEKGNARKLWGLRHVWKLLLTPQGKRGPVLPTA